MSTPIDEYERINHPTIPDGRQSALVALTASNNHSAPSNPRFPPPGPELRSDNRSNATVSQRSSTETTATWSSTFSSLSSGTRSAVASLVSSRATSIDLDQVLKETHSAEPSLQEKRGPLYPTTSRFSTLTVESNDEPTGDGFDHFTRKGVVYNLVQEATKAATLRGVVDVHDKKLLLEIWRKKIWDMIENPEIYIERHLGQQRENAAKALLQSNTLNVIIRAPLTTPASLTDTPLAATPSVEVTLERDSDLFNRPRNGFHTPQRSVNSMTASFHTAVSERGNRHSMNSTFSSQNSEVLSSMGMSTLSLAGINTTFDAENQGSVENFPQLPDGPVQPGTLASYRRRNSWSSTKSASSQSSAEGDAGARKSHEQFQIDVRIFHPDPHVEVAIIDLALCDCQSSHSHISPKALQKFGIALNNDKWVKPTDYHYWTNDGAYVKSRGCIDLTWRAFSDDGVGKYHTNTFYIAGDEAPYDGVLLGLDHLIPKGGTPRMIYRCLINVRGEKTKEEKKEAAKAKIKNRREVRENDKLKKEQAKKDQDHNQANRQQASSTTSR